MSHPRIILALCLIPALPATVMAELPADQVVVLDIKEDPSNPESATAFSIRLSLTAIDQDGRFVAWSPVRVELESPYPDGTSAKWVDDTPGFWTVDGLWWVEHADLLKPAAADFTHPPFSYSVARAKDPGDSDMYYYFQSHEQTITGEQPYEATTSLTLEMTLHEIQTETTADQHRAGEVRELVRKIE